MTERVCVFIDGSNFYHACRSQLGRTDIRIGDLARWLVGAERTLIRTYYYNCPLPPDAPEEARRSQNRFFNALHRTPYLELRLGRLAQRESTCPSCRARQVRWVEKGVDMKIGIDMAQGAARGLFDTAVLVSGDADLAEAVRATKDTGRHVEVASFAGHFADELAQAADVSRLLTAPDLRRFIAR